ncbi:MAG: helix-turn-helix transcriptional regulator [Verrucomicrobia bacterium]|nr:helix-turn-helix transcriptional regulator [Verrucomicrobiota bacterium]
MQYTQLFRKLREEKGLTLDALARLSRCHRNTIVNLESGRRVRLKTLIQLMQRMGFSNDSPEMGSVMMLYFESITNIPFSQSKTQAAARRAIGTYRSGARQAAQQLQLVIQQSGLSQEQIELLLFAARHRNMLTILGLIRDTEHDLRSEAAAPDLKVAED